MLFHMAESCDTPESKDRSNREYKACLRERAIPRLLDHNSRSGNGMILGSMSAVDEPLRNCLRTFLERFLLSFLT